MDTTNEATKTERYPGWLGSSILLLGSLMLTVLTLWSLGHTPPPWWDEGWTMLVAQNLVEAGVYGSISIDGPQFASMAASPPNTLLVALSFRVFGVGIWQARVPAAMLTIISLGLVFVLTQALYNRVIGITSVILLMLTTAHLSTNPLYAGRQVLGEPLQILALLAGYIALLTSKQRPIIAWGFACLLWGLALVAKGQTLPFWVASLACTMFIAILQQRWRVAMLLSAAIAGGLLMRQIWNEVLLSGLAGRIPSAESIPDVTSLVGFAPVASERVSAVLIMLIAGLPALIGVIYTAWPLLRHPRAIKLEEPTELIRVMLLALAASWIAWFLFLSIGWARYLYPALVVAAPFSAALLYHASSGFHVRRWLDAIVIGLKEHKFGQAIAGFLTASFLIIAIPTTLWQLDTSYQGNQAAPLQNVTTFLNTQTPTNAVIETYESEILFLLNRRYHYPPDTMNVTLLQRGVQGSAISLNYDPLAADPDYLVTSYYVTGTGIYEPAITAGHFRLIKRFGWYDVYQRVR